MFSSPVSGKSNITISVLIFLCFFYLFRIEKEYTALKSKENEDQIELRVKPISFGYLESKNEKLLIELMNIQEKTDSEVKLKKRINNRIYLVI